MNSEGTSIATRAAVYLRVSTARQADHDVSIPDQKRQGETVLRFAGLPTSKPMWSRARQPPTTVALSSSA